MYIQVIDDNIELTRHLKKILLRKGHGVKVYNSSKDFTSAGDFSADIYLMDINLGDGDGFDLVKYMRLDKKINNPIIMISGQTKTGTKKISFTIGADDYLEKPFTSDELEMRIDNIVHHIESREKVECGCSEKPLFSCLSEEEKIKIFNK